MEKLNINHPEFAQLSSEILEMGNALRFIAHGSSMAPFIRDGDVLTVEPADPTMLRVGQIVFYRSSGETMVAHRVVRIKAKGETVLLTIRGDASPGSEDVIPSDMVLGHIVNINRMGEKVRINDGMWRRLGLAWIILHPLPLIAYRVLRKIRSPFSQKTT
jgi:hypothetical protein